MNQQLFPLPFRWRVVLDWTRAAVGAIYLVRILALDPAPLHRAAALFAAYLLFAAAWAWRLSVSETGGRAGTALIPLVVDLAVLLASLLWLPFYPWLATFFCVYVLIAAAVRHSSREVALVGISAAGFTFALPPEFRDTLLLPVLAAGTCSLVLSRHAAGVRARMSQSLRQAVVYRAEAERARESERQRIAADFHDGPLQSFVGFQMRLEILRKLLDRNIASAREELAQLQDLCRSQVAELRAFVRSMRPMEVDSAGLSASVRRLIEGYQKDTGIEVRLEGADVAGPPQPDVVLEVLQIIREALHNVRKHSQASRVQISLGSSGNCLELAVADNGNGFDFAGTYSLEELELLRRGPASVMRRVRNLGGELTLASHPGRGSELRVRVPA